MFFVFFFAGYEVFVINLLACITIHTCIVFKFAGFYITPNGINLCQNIYVMVQWYIRLYYN